MSPAAISSGASGANFYVGLSPHEANDDFGGDMDEVAIFSSPLSSTDINDIMDNGLVQAAGNPTSANTTLQGIMDIQGAVTIQ